VRERKKTVAVGPGTWLYHRVHTTIRDAAVGARFVVDFSLHSMCGIGSLLHLAFQPNEISTLHVRRAFKAGHTAF